MSIASTAQQNFDEPLPHSIVELQAMAMGMLLIWDALDNAYRCKEQVERALLKDWSVKYGVPWPMAVESLIVVKTRLTEVPWTYFVSCRDFQKEGWYSLFTFCPDSNADVTSQIEGILKARPFPDKEEK